jgi:hypothetical protein
MVSHTPSMTLWSLVVELGFSAILPVRTNVAAFSRWKAV